MRNRWLFMLVLPLLLCSCDKNIDMVLPSFGPSEWTTAKVAVVLPLSGRNADKARYERVWKMFEENVSKAQYAEEKLESKKIKKQIDKTITTHRQKIGMVFQNFNLFPHFTVLRNITEAQIHVLGRSKAQAQQRGRELLAKMGLSDKENAYPCELSGGQQQRVAIARAVVSAPKLILADEPTGNLDSKNGKEVMDLLSELNAEGTTIVMVTHSQKDAAVAQRVINLFDGQIVGDVKNEL